MAPKKIWVRRPGATATLVTVREDDMVDDVKDAILRKYGNSLGRHFDAPDVTLRINPRNHGNEVILSPDELLAQAVERYFPGRQLMEEALLVHVPQKRTPKQSPGGQLVHYHHHAHSAESVPPHESSTDYFPPMPIAISPGALHLQHIHPEGPRAMSVLTTGQVPPLASPGGTRRTLTTRAIRPGTNRQQTASPTMLSSSTMLRNSRPRKDSETSEKHSLPTTLPTPPAVETIKNQNSPTPRVASPRPVKPRKQVRTKPSPERIALPATIVDTPVPPINVLIVEDNMINMRLLEQFVRKLKVHWATAVNGREAVNKWRQGGFHLVLMDIQLPIMSGLDATREIRRLERVNHIGVLSGSNHSSLPPVLPAGEENGEDTEVKEEDKLGDAQRLFKSPVIIVALTASNLQSDRHEALAAGCNDFLTKPVNFGWFERKVKEWGCMQALIDFDGWRMWKNAAVQNGLKDASNPRPGAARKKVVEKPPITTDNSNDSVEGAGAMLKKESSEDTVKASA
ncbi:CheY-like protein [Microthyrium microscopicum]|uniref:CheY-like protein n=1 Tax=Microthyrium microscopicum TaxID=703497 RepID=A0A6A6U1W9_9PEZI|nr:CheY-like protein [Microthyrium microscopicum]